MTRPARALLVLAAAAPALVLVASPAAAAPTAAPVPTYVEAESVRSAVVQDPTASGRRATALAPGRSLTVRLSAPSTGSRLVLRLRSAAAQAPTIAVDGRATPGPVPATTWRDLATGSGSTVGAHTVTITNPAGRRSALLVDRVAFVATRAHAVVPLDDAYEARIVQLVNVHRSAAGLPRLAVSACADRYAEDWSATMVRTSSFTHRPSLASVMTACRASAVGENIAYGAVTADAMMKMWMASPGHRANILNPRSTHIGVGAAQTAAGRTYGTQNFLRL